MHHQGQSNVRLMITGVKRHGRWFVREDTPHCPIQNDAFNWFATRLLVASCVRIVGTCSIPLFAVKAHLFVGVHFCRVSNDQVTCWEAHADDNSSAQSPVSARVLAVRTLGFCNVCCIHIFVLKEHFEEILENVLQTVQT